MNPSGQLPPPFVVSTELVEEIRGLITSVVRRSRASTVTVPAEEFPAWLVALGKSEFHAQRTKSGMAFIRSGYTFIGDDPVNSPMLSVTCYDPPAPWVTFPENEGDRRYMFRYTLNLLAHNETESTQ